MPEFDRYAGNYDETVNQAIRFSGLTVDFFTKAKSDDLLRTVATRLRPTENLDLLDVGCGVGNYHPAWLPRFRSVRGVDVSSDSLAVARSANPGARYDVYDGKRLPFDDAGFDVLVAICVLHHIPPDQWGALAGEFNRVLRPGGLVLIYEHNPLNPLTRRVVNSCAFDKDAVLLWPRPTRALFAAQGFSRVKSRSILTIPHFNGALAALDRAIGWQPLGAQFVVEAMKVA